MAAKECVDEEFRRPTDSGVGVRRKGGDTAGGDRTSERAVFFSLAAGLGVFADAVGLAAVSLAVGDLAASLVLPLGCFGVVGEGSFDSDTPTMSNAFSMGVTPLSGLALATFPLAWATLVETAATADADAGVAGDPGVMVVVLSTVRDSSGKHCGRCCDAAVENGEETADDGTGDERPACCPEVCASSLTSSFAQITLGSGEQACTGNVEAAVARAAVRALAAAVVVAVV